MRPTTRSSRVIRPAPVNACEAPKTSDSSENDKSIIHSTVQTEKNKKPRHRMTNRQLEHLEALYQRATHPSRQEKETLANKVAMDMRTVTVWFQNRRQLAKKSDENSSRDLTAGHENKGEYRVPLSSVDRPDENIGEMERGPALHKAMSALHAAACKQVQATVDAACPPSSLPSNSHAPLMIRIGDYEPEEAPRVRKSSNKRMLEWACSHTEKRRRLHRVEGKENHGDTTDEDFTPPNVLATFKRRPLKDITIPQDLSTLFAPDIVLGASLLLTFKYSSDN